MTKPVPVIEKAPQTEWRLLIEKIYNKIEYIADESHALRARLSPVCAEQPLRDNGERAEGSAKETELERELFSICNQLDDRIEYMQDINASLKL